MSADPDWRTRHCGDVAADAIRAASGRDIWEEIGMEPRSPRELAAIYRAAGVRSIDGLVTYFLGPPIDRKRARRGDVVMMQRSLGICRGEVAEFFGGVVPMRAVEKVWSCTARPCS